MRRVPLLLALVLLLGVLPGAALASAAHFTLELDGFQELPAVATPARGTGSFTLTSLGLQFFITAEGLSGPITGARIFDGPPGLPGVAVRDILGEFSGTNTAAGLWTPTDPMPLTSSLIAALMRGDLHVNLYTAANPGGEIRGQLRLSAGAHLTANLQGAQENPPVAVAGTGAGSFTLTEEGLQFKLTLNGLTGAIAAARIYRGAIGVNGAVLHDLMPFFSGNTAVGLLVLSAAERKDLLAGNLYVNVHTAAHPGGELRGQILLAGGYGFTAKMDGAQEVPPNAAPGLGTVSATLTPSGLMVDFTADGLTGPITVSHIHRGPPGVGGPPVRTIAATEYLTTTTAALLWRADDAEPLTPGLVAELLNGNLYVNLHTAALPGGEIRGQLIPNLPTAASPIATYTANLTGDEEEPPVPAPATGTGTFSLTPAGLTFRITVENLSGAITGAHFHIGGIGVGGGAIVRGLVAGEFLSATTMAGLWAPGDPSPLTPALVTELIKGNIYFNVHTAAAPGGEIRGQLVPASGAELEARLTGAQETPPLGVVGTGTGSFTLTQHGLAFNVTWSGLTGAVTGAHIHSGGPGVAGPIVRGFSAGEFVTGNTVAGVWKPTDASALTAALMTELLKGNLYVNVHTAANPGGEIRGQIVLAGGDARNARLMGAQEVPPVVTPGMGTAAMTVADQGMVFRLSANDMMGGLVDAHVHEAPPGVNGPVVRPIFGEFTNQTADGVWKPTDGAPLTAALLRSLHLGNLYLNLHTTAFGGGEIRGQIGQSSTVGVEPTALGEPLELTSAPNPVSGPGTLSFRLPKAADVTLTLHDVSGALVRRLASGPHPAGWSHVAVDAAGLANGMYFYKLQTGESRGSGKLLVIR